MALAVLLPLMWVRRKNLNAGNPCALDCRSGQRDRVRWEQFQFLFAARAELHHHPNRDQRQYGAQHIGQLDCQIGVCQLVGVPRWKDTLLSFCLGSRPPSSGSRSVNRQG